MTSPPVHLQAADTASTVFLVVAALFFVASLAWAYREGRLHRSAVPWLALLGGGIASLEESWVDHLIQLWYPLDAPVIMFAGMGTPQPLYLHLIYPGFIGLGAYATYLGLKRYPDGRLLWPTFFGVMALDLAFEASATWAGVFYYYGQQPFQFFPNGWPLWVAPINAAGPLLGGWLILKLEPYLRGRRRPLIALLPPLAYSGIYGATGWPTATLMNSSVPMPWVWGGAIVTAALCVIIVQLIKLSLSPPEDSPAR